MLRIAGVIILFIAINVVLAQGQSQNNAARRQTPSQIRQPMRRPNRPVDANEMTQRDKTHQQMREQMREQAIRRHRLADQNEMADMNAPGAKGRREMAGKTAGEMHKQQLKMLEQQTSQELAKHRERVAKLTRIRDLAQQQGDTKTVERVDKLLEQDKNRYEAMTKRMERRKNTIIEFQKKATEEKQKGDDDAGKNSDRPEKK